jgi:WD40 repeat protein
VKRGAPVGFARRVLEPNAQHAISPSTRSPMPLPSPTRWTVALLVLIGLASSGCGGGDGRRDTGARAAAAQLRIRLPALLPRRPAYAAGFALAADSLDPSPGSELAMLSVAAQQHAVARVIAAHRGPATAATRVRSAIVTAGTDGFLRTWDPRTGAKLGERRVGATIVRLAASEAVGATVASVDEEGHVAVWDLSHATRPVARQLSPGAGKRAPVTLGFSPNGVQLLSLGADGGLRRWDVASGASLRTVDLQAHRSSLPWRRHRVTLTAATFVGQVYDQDPSVLVATRDGAIAKVNLRTATGRIVVPAGKITGPISALAYLPYKDYDIAAGTPEGVVWWKDDDNFTVRDSGPPVTALAAIDDDEVLKGGTGGVARATAETSDPPIGAAVRAISATKYGAVAAAADGTVAVYDLDDDAGLTAPPTRPTAFARLGPAHQMLITDSGDPNHVKALMAVRLGVPGLQDGAPVANRPVRTYKPARSWWPQGEGADNHWFVSGGVFGDKYVVTAGQDPTGVAVVLVWDAKTARPLARLPLTTGGVKTDQPSYVAGFGILQDSGLLAAYSPVQESIAFWSTKTWRRTATVNVGPIASLSFTRDEKQVAVTSRPADGADTPDMRTSLTFIDVAKGRVDHTVGLRGLNQVDFSPDGKYLATFTQGKLQLRSPDGRKVLTAPVRYEDGDGVIEEWRPDSKLIAIARKRTGTVLADPWSGVVSEPLSAPAGTAPSGLGWSDDGRLLVQDNFQDDATPPAAAEPTLWTLDPRHLRQKLCAVEAGAFTAASWRREMRGAGAPRALCPRPAAPSRRTAAGRAIADPVVAFRAGNSLYVADRDGHRQLIGGARPEDYSVQTFSWSRAGALGWAANGRAHVLRAGRVSSWACPCEDVAFDKETLTAVDADGSGLLRFDPSGVRRRGISGLPRYQPRLLAVASGRAIVTGFATQPERGTPSEIFRVSSGPTARRIALSRKGPVYGVHAVSPDGRRVAWAETAGGGACYSIDSIGLLDVAAGKVSYPALPGSPDASRTLRSVSWAPDGTLDAILAPSSCDGSNGSPPVSPPGRLVAVGHPGGDESVDAYDVQQGDGVRAELLGPVAVSDRKGRLVLVGQDGRRVLVARKAQDMSVRP